MINFIQLDLVFLLWPKAFIEILMYQAEPWHLLVLSGITLVHSSAASWLIASLHPSAFLVLQEGLVLSNITVSQQLQPESHVEESNHWPIFSMSIFTPSVFCKTVARLTIKMALSPMFLTEFSSLPGESFLYALWYLILSYSKLLIPHKLHTTLSSSSKAYLGLPIHPCILEEVLLGNVFLLWLTFLG